MFTKPESSSTIARPGLFQTKPSLVAMKARRSVIATRAWSAIAFRWPPSISELPG
jgi:hypothetical protein